MADGLGVGDREGVGVTAGLATGTLKRARIESGPVTVKATSELELGPLGVLHEVKGCAEGSVAVTASLAVSPQATASVLTLRSKLWTAPPVCVLTAPRTWLAKLGISTVSEQPTLLSGVEIGPPAQPAKAPAKPKPSPRPSAR